MMKKICFLLFLLMLLGRSIAIGAVEDLAGLVEARTVVERVYYDHRTGTKPPFEEAVVEAKVRTALKKERLLKEVYRIEVTEEMVANEVARIEAKTRAPEMLAEIVAALGNDAGAFAKVFAKPLLVERELRSRFENDDALHSGKRGEAERFREEVLKAEGVAARRAVMELEGAKAGQVGEVTWQLGVRPREEDGNGEGLQLEDLPPEIGPVGPGAKILSGSRGDGSPGEERKRYIEDVPAPLRRVLEAQLREAGDVSAVIELPRGFLIYVASEVTDEVLGVVSVTVRKANYGEWVRDSVIKDR